MLFNYQFNIKSSQLIKMPSTLSSITLMMRYNFMTFWFSKIRSIYNDSLDSFHCFWFLFFYIDISTNFNLLRYNLNNLVLSLINLFNGIIYRTWWRFGIYVLRQPISFFLFPQFITFSFSFLKQVSHALLYWYIGLIFIKENHLMPTLGICTFRIRQSLILWWSLFRNFTKI